METEKIPVRTNPASLRELVTSLASKERAPRLVVVLLGSYAVASFPELSDQQFIVAKTARRVTPADFDLPCEVEILGEAVSPLPVLMSALRVFARHGWWVVTGGLALSWLLLVLSDYAFAARLAELALSGSVVGFVLFQLVGRANPRPGVAGKTILSGAWQSLVARERAAGRILAAAAGISLAGVVFSHSTMAALEMSGYFTPLTAGTARALLAASLSAGSVMSLAMGIAALTDLARARQAVIVEQQAAVSLIEAQRVSSE